MSNIKLPLLLNPNSLTITVLSKEAASVLLFIKSKNKEDQHPTRNELNLHFKADSDCKKNQRLTLLILNLLQYGWLKHQVSTLEDSRVYYWHKDFPSKLEPKKLFARPIEHQDLYQAYLDKDVVTKTIVNAPTTAINTAPATEPTTEPTTALTAPAALPTTAKKSKSRIGTKLIDPSLVNLLTRSQLGGTQYQPAQKVKYGVLKIVEFLGKTRVENIIEVANAIGINKKACELCLNKSTKELSNVDNSITLNEFGVFYISQYESTRIQSDWLAVVATNILAQSNSTDYCVSTLVNLVKTYPLDVQKQVAFLLK